MNRLKKISELIEFLPKKDKNLAIMFLKKRDFDSLLELVSSLIIIINKNLNSDKIKEEYLSVNLDNLFELQTQIDLYSMNIRDRDFSEIINNYEEAYDEPEF